jgi:hypothetical protein
MSPTGRKNQALWLYLRAANGPGGTQVRANRRRAMLAIDTQTVDPKGVVAAAEPLRD